MKDTTSSTTTTTTTTNASSMSDRKRTIKKNTTSIRPSRNAAKSKSTINKQGTSLSKSSSGIAIPTTTTTTATNPITTTRVSFAEDINTINANNNNNNDTVDRGETTNTVSEFTVEDSLILNDDTNIHNNNDNDVRNDDDDDYTIFETEPSPHKEMTSIIVTQSPTAAAAPPPRTPARPTTTGTKSKKRPPPLRRPPLSTAASNSSKNNNNNNKNKKLRTTKKDVTTTVTASVSEVHPRGDDDDVDDATASVITTNAVAGEGTAMISAATNSISKPLHKPISSQQQVTNNTTATTTTGIVTTNNKNNNNAVMSSSLSCPNCGSNAIEQHEASGATICTECGVVVEENAIVSSIEFVEGAGGSSNMVGQYVSATSSKAYTTGGSGGHNIRGGGRYGFSRDSRETTLANGRRRIQELASRLRLSSHYVDGAHRLFTVAVERNFVQGRRTSHVVAACLYIACRQEKSQHMLIDFSDALQVNVYTLGTCFLKFRRLLGLKLEIIDPALYVYRFAAHLDLDDRANAVSLTSLRLVARMKRDWIVAGRRPAGICAAALLIAARAHGFDKHCADVTRILRVCGMTVTNRIREFERTPTAHLSLDQFQTIDFEAEADPPIYTKNKIREARAKAIQEGNVQLLTSGVLDDDGKSGSRWRNATKKQKQASERKLKFQELYQSLDKKLNDDDGEEDEENNIVENGADVVNDEKAIRADQLVVHDRNAKLVAEKDTSSLVQWKDAYPKIRGRNIVMPHEATVEEQLPSIVPTEAKLSLSDWKQSLPNEIDVEIEEFFRTSKEEKEKEAIFNKINKDYIAQQERKENERLDLEAATKDQDVDDLAQAAGQARYKDVVGRNNNANAGSGGTYSKSKRHRDSSDVNTSATTEEQLRAAVASRKVSRKINYDALSSIFDDDGSFATSSGMAANDYGNNDDDDNDDDLNNDSHEMQEEVMI